MKSSKNLVWLDINSSYSHSSLALPAIDATRVGDDYHWSCVSGTLGSDIYLICKNLYERKPDIIAGTMWLFNHKIMLSICTRIKALMPEVVIILGGPEFNGDNQEFLRMNTCVNYVFRGEGEHGFHEFLKGERNVTGLCYIDAKGDYVDLAKARVDDFASLPEPELSEFFCYSSPFVQLEFSRGCFNSCAFCVSGGDKPIRVKPIEQIKARIERVRDKSIKDIRVLDRTFNFSVRRAKEMLELFKQYPDMNFHLEIHPALLSDELCEILSSMPNNLLHLEAGMQSLDDKVITASERLGSNEDAISGLTKLCQMTNFETHADLIAGLPFYTLVQIFKDVQQLSEIGAGEIQLELLKLLPGTKMRAQAKEHGIKYSPEPPYEVLETPDASIFELDRARLLSKLLDKFYNAKPWQGVMREIINENDNFLEDFLVYLIPTELLEKPLSLQRRGELLYDFLQSSVQYNKYLDSLAIAWIENGISLKAKPAGKVEKTRQLPESITRESNMHYYTWSSGKREIIFGFDRSKNHSYPVLKVEI
ncbi:MAG: DUF4080 domain-containing protein [Rikenellaceae bacterium]